MDREVKKYLKSIKDRLESAGYSVEDLVEYCRQLEAKKAEMNSGKPLPFEVMYDGMIRSKFPIKGKQPLGVIFENYLITLKKSPERLSWQDAKKYCKEIEICGQPCSLGPVELWHLLIKQKKQELLDNLLEKLDGEPLSSLWGTLWTDSTCDFNDFYGYMVKLFVFPNHTSETYERGIYNRLEYRGACPVFDLVSLPEPLRSDLGVEFPFEVMYEGMVRSKIPLEGKKPLGVIFENHLISLKTSGKMTRNSAASFCYKYYKYDDHCSSFGERKFWEKVRESERLEELELTLYRLGGEAFGDEWIWTDLVMDKTDADSKFYYIANIHNETSIDFVCDSKTCCKVRPVLNLTDLPY